MDVHVDQGRIDFQEQAADRIAALHQRGVVALDQRQIQTAMLDGTAVDEEVLVLAGGTRNARCTDEAANPQRDPRRVIRGLRFHIGIADRAQLAGEIHFQ